MCRPATGSVQQKPTTPHPPSSSPFLTVAGRSKLSINLFFDSRSRCISSSFTVLPRNIVGIIQMHQEVGTPPELGYASQAQALENGDQNVPPGVVQVDD